jgi:hypothetical protein
MLKDTWNAFKTMYEIAGYGINFTTLLAISSLRLVFSGIAASSCSVCNMRTCSYCYSSDSCVHSYLL